MILCLQYIVRACAKLSMPKHSHTQDYDLLESFTKTGSMPDEMKSAREKYILRLYRVSNFESLDEYRHIAYKLAIGRTSLSSSFKLAGLPATSAAAKQHLYRPYHTVQK